MNFLRSLREKYILSLIFLAGGLLGFAIGAAVIEQMAAEICQARVVGR